ncbi:MAG: hypothetical protein AAF805_04640 [Planctomycetota bacterium]
MSVGVGVVLLRPASATEWAPMPVEWPRAGEAAIDLSRWLHKPAGKDGFIRRDGARLRDGAGRRWRVWGVNLTGGDCFPPKDRAALVASDLARLGVNCVRFHHLDEGWPIDLFIDGADNTQEFDPEALDRLDFFVAALKERGVYTNLNLNVLRRYRSGDGVRDWDRLGPGKGATYFNPRLIELQEGFARRLLTHRNPYTGNEYRREPAVAVVEIVNENSLLEAWKTRRLVGRDDGEPGPWSPLPTSYAEELTTRYNRWLADNASTDQLARLRVEAGVAPGDAVPRLNPGQFGAASELRFRLEARFLMGLEESFFRRMRALLRDELRVGSLLVGDADHADFFSGHAHQIANRPFDVIDGHGYWQHPSTRGAYRTENTPMVNDPLDSTVVQFARTPVVGRPFTISETSHLWPHRYACEGVPILTAYALLHDWDGVYWFSFGAERFRRTAPGVGQAYQFGHDPVKVSQLIACGQLFHAAAVAPSPTRAVRGVSTEHAVRSLRSPYEHRPFFHAGIKRSEPLRRATRVRYEESSSVDETLGDPPNEAVQDYRSVTDQLRWTGAADRRGLVEIDTPQCQGVVGFVGDAAHETRDAVFRVDNEFAAVIVTSLDGQPLSRSKRVLVHAGAGVKNSGLRWEADGKTIAAWGDAPIVMEPVKGTVEMRGSTEPLRITPLGPLAEPIGGSRHAEGGIVQLDRAAPLWLVERVGGR